MNEKVDPKQIGRFKEAALRIGCDEDEAVFDEKLKAIAKQKPKPGKPPAEGA